MSDSCMHELEDIVWDDFCQSDDHIVPHPNCDSADEHFHQSESRKKSRREVVDVSYNTGDRSLDKYVHQEKGLQESSTLNNARNTMLEKGSWSDAQDCMFSSSPGSDSVKEVSNLASESTKTTNHCFKTNNLDSIGNEFCTDDTILNDKSNSVDGNSYGYTLGHISQTDDDLNFFDNNYGWPEIGNFEDVDRMFRSCDSTFGLRAANEDELGWFSSSDAIEGSGDAVKSDFKYSCPQSSVLESMPENHVAPRLSEASEPMNDSGIKSATGSYKDDWHSQKDESASISHLSFLNRSSAPDSKDEFTPVKQVNVHKKQFKHQNQSEGKRREQSLKNGGSFHYIENFSLEETKVTCGTTSCQSFTSVGIQQQKQARQPDSHGYLQKTVPYMHSDFSSPSDQTSLHPTLSALKCEPNGIMSFSPKESSYASNHMQSMESSPDPSFQGTMVKLNEKRVEKQVHHSGKKFENQNGIEGVNMEIPAELASSIVQESSSMSSGLDEISQEAASFRQLQRVMEKLDLRTKLCIRDSLYRLARSAEQRHKQANLNGGCRDDQDVGGAIMVGGTDNGCMDMETDTNPIDRSIAHLLFHRPSESSVVPVHDSISFRSPVMIHGSITNPPLVAEKLVNLEEGAPETDKQVADH